MPFFAGLDAAALDRVASGTRIRRFRRGEVVFHVGDPGDALFLISSGSVKITLPSETGEEAILATLQPGEVLASCRCSMARRGPRRPSPSSRPRRSSSSATAFDT
jgi:CRP-like cAMP-binding protein